MKNEIDGLAKRGLVGHTIGVVIIKAEVQVYLVPLTD